jgi:hypothetical protein
MEYNNWMCLDSILVAALDRGAVSEVVIQVAEEHRRDLRDGTLGFVESALSGLKTQGAEFLSVHGSVKSGLY